MKWYIPQLIPCDLGASVDRLGVGVVGVVDDDGGVFAREEEGDDDVRADVAQSTGDHYFLRKSADLDFVMGTRD